MNPFIKYLPTWVSYGFLIARTQKPSFSLLPFPLVLRVCLCHNGVPFSQFPQVYDEMNRSSFDCGFKTEVESQNGES